MKYLYCGLVVMIMVCAVGAIGESDYQERKKYARYYCGMVESGKWPHYDGSINCEDL